MDNFLDIFSDDAFGLVSMVAAINNIDNIPGRAGQLAFAGTGQGVATTTVTIESKSESLALIQTSARGGPSPQEKGDKGKIVPVGIPQIKDESTIGANEVQGVRAFGSSNLLVGVQSVVNTRLVKITRKMDLTLEHHRLGALRGIVRDADGSPLTNLYDLFGVTEAPDFNFDLENATADVRQSCMDLTRYMKRNVKMTLPAGYKIWAFCGDNFFDKLINHASVKSIYTGWAAAEARLGGNYAQGVFYFADIYFENYAGTDDQTSDFEGTVGIHPDEARFFLTGVPGLYEEYFAPADFWDTANTLGLPRYARTAMDTEMQRWVKLHVQMNPLPLCLRPRTLVRGVATGEVTSDHPQSAD